MSQQGTITRQIDTDRARLIPALALRWPNQDKHIVDYVNSLHGEALAITNDSTGYTAPIHGVAKLISDELAEIDASIKRHPASSNHETDSYPTGIIEQELGRRVLAISLENRSLLPGVAMDHVLQEIVDRWASEVEQ